ncbi:MAG: hypothetical protein MJ161_05230 [Clostridia bacterium]|nr:hypothetical protein [Clostridia bacterium]
MILCTKEGTTFEGSLIDNIQDTTNILIGLRETLNKQVTSEATDAVIALIGRAAFAEDEETRDKLCDDILKVLVAGRRAA